MNSIWIEDGEPGETINETILSYDPASVMLHGFPTHTIESYYRTEEGLQKILISGSLLSVLIVLFQTLITLGQTRKTARRNPVDALSYE